MSAENLLKILEIFNKPLHLAVIGLFLILWGKYISDKNTCIFVGIMCILYSICECIAQWWKKRTAHKEDEKRKIQKWKMEEKKRQEIINSYLELPLEEKQIIDFCCCNNRLCYFSGTIVGFYDNEKSLCARGFGKIQGMQFIMDKTFFDILRAYIVKKPVGQNKKKQKNMQKSNWKKCKLSDVADVRDGTHDSPKEVSVGGFPLVTSRHISNGRVDLRDTYNISEKDFNAINLRSKVDGGDILISMIGTVGQIAYVAADPRYAIKNVGLIKPNKWENSKYIFYYLKSPTAQEDIVSRLKGTTQQYLSLGELRNFPITLPPLEEQKRIAEILGSLDDKIELLQKQNKTLEDMAKALFKSWFVDFDVVRAKQKGLPKADIMREYHLTEELYDLFPFSFADSPLGPIPSGWEVKPLSKIATFLNGLALQKYPARAEEDFLPVIKIAELRNGISTSTDKANTNLPTEYIVHNGDILFSWSGSLMVKVWSGEKGALNQHLFKVFSNGYPKWFYYLWVNHYLPMFQEIAADKATTMGHIQRKHLDQAKVVCPSAAFLDKMDKIFGVILSKIILNNKQIQTLTELRDTLLPRLISGKIRV